MKDPRYTMLALYDLTRPKPSGMTSKFEFIDAHAEQFVLNNLRWTAYAVLHDMSIDVKGKVEPSLPLVKLVLLDRT